MSDEEENEEEEDKGDVEGDEYDKGEEDEKDREDEEDGGNQSEGVELVEQDDGGARPFILPAIWTVTVNDFYPMMFDKVFNTIRDCYQIPESIPLCLPEKFERCYFGKTADVGMYDTMFATSLRLPLMELHC